MALPSGLDPRTPVIVGVAQLVDRTGDSPEPVALMTEALRLAAADAGAPQILGAADVVGVVPVVSWRYFDPAALVAGNLGARPRERWHPAMGGNTPQKLVNKGACSIQAGNSDVVLVCGGESYRTRQSLRRSGGRPDWTQQRPEDEPTWGDAQRLEIGHPAEMALGIFLPTQCYPLFESAIRHVAGRTAAEHTAVIAQLWAGFSEVASHNPFAIDRTAYSAEEIATVDDRNRMIGFPYTKHMVSNPDIDAATGVVMCSAERADALGIARDRWVFPWSGADGDDPLLSLRPRLTGSSAIRVAGGAALQLAGVGVDELAHLDVYSCFPSAVQIACAELGIGLDRQLTVYGGLCFAGGPWNNPVGHAIAAMVDTLRGDAGSIGFVTANGGIIQKHAFGVYSTEPPRSGGFAHAHPQFAIDSSEPGRDVSTDHDGAVEIEAFTVMHERDGSMARAHAAVLTPSGDRAWAVTDDAEVMARMETDDLVGASALRSADGTLTL